MKANIVSSKLSEKEVPLDEGQVCNGSSKQVQNGPKPCKSGLVCAKRSNDPEVKGSSVCKKQKRLRVLEPSPAQGLCFTLNPAKPDSKPQCIEHAYVTKELLASINNAIEENRKHPTS